MEWMKAKLGSKKRLALAFVLVALFGSGAYRMLGGGASAAEFMTAKVERGNLRNSVTATGALQAVTTVQVGSQASGTISALYADFNSTVKKGQVIAQLDPSTVAAQVEQARAALQLAELNMAHTTIRSPIDGVVVSRDVNVGQTVAASLSAPTLFTIAQDLKAMQVIANIDQADIGLVEQAKSVRFTVDAFPADEFEGTIQQLRLNPVSAQNVVTYNVVIDVANPEQKLKPGMTANLTITIDERRDVLKVPNAALRFTPQPTGEQRRARGQSRAQGNGGAQGNGERAARRQQGANDANAGGGDPTAQVEGQGEGARRGNVAPANSPVLEGQTRRVWVLGADGQLQPRRIKVGLTDGSATELVEGELKEGDVIITGQNVTAAARTQTSGGGTQTAPGFGGAPRGGAGGGRR